MPPRQTCERCLEDIRENWVELGNTGVVWKILPLSGMTTSTCHARPCLFLGLIRPAKGADTPMVHIIDGS
ncbi:MAG: hypothetical protein R2874_14970 [Desulfobacterales bacterium]